MQYITKQQLREIKEFYYDMDTFDDELKEYTGIEARPHIEYQYFDSCGDYIGSSDTSSLEDLLDAAHIEVI